MKQVLPQLARPEIYARLKSGPARGGEAVIMVENIRNYNDILSRVEPAHASPYAMQLMLRLPEFSPSQPSTAEAPLGP
jgi:membrane-bound lytic murein transglycosylase MltF